MIRYALRRLFFYGLAGCMAIVINFFLPRLMPGDPATTMFAKFRGKLKPEALESMKKTFGLSDAPLHIQFWEYLQALLSGDFGTSLAYFPMPVSDVISMGLLWTVYLSGTALIVSFLIGTFLGAASAWWRGGVLDYMPAVFSFLGAFPYFWMAMLILAVLGFEWNWFPTKHAYDARLSPELSFTFIQNVLVHTFLPATTMVISGIGMWLMTMRSSMISTMSDEFVQFARVRGLGMYHILFRYAMRVALLPSLTGFGISLGFVISGALLTEMVFAYPGQGYILIQAVRAQDYPLMQGIFLSISLSVLLANWLVDCLTLVLDPRTREVS